MKSRSAGDLRESVGFFTRYEGNDGAGNFSDAWRQVFSGRAGFVHLRGGEAVLAGRLAGVHTLVIFVRASVAARAVDTDWAIQDLRTNVSYAIRDITLSDDRLWLDFLCQSGVAEG